jgi:SAM-dependent methyltransferase
MPDYENAYREDGQLLVHQRADSVNAYSLCRCIPERVLKYFNYIILRENPKRILDAGCGCGRLLVPLVKQANSDVQFYGVDISEAMLSKLREIIQGRSNMHLFCADLKDKRFFSSHFSGNIDVTYTFATLHILSNNWQLALDNLASSINTRGKIILGEEINAVFHGTEELYEGEDYRLKDLSVSFGESATKDATIISDFFKVYHQLRREHHVPFKRVHGQILHGDQSPAERYLRAKGFSQRTVISQNLRWLKPHTLEDILYCFKNGTITTLGSDLPTKVRKSIALALESLCKEKEYDITKIMNIPAEIQMHIFTHNDERANENNP